MFGISDTYLIILFLFLFLLLFLFILVTIATVVSLRKLGNYLPKFPDDV